ncbi:hypothetical protein B0H11DRAFT_2214647 [Mycena galericulata]|nr:hypothetical protein B0H11DRAFT_2214647 [Mycena galericulata]
MPPLLGLPLNASVDPPRSTGWALLPFDIRFIIFQMLLVLSPFDLTFYKLCAKIIAISPVFMLFVMGQPSFWSRIYVSSSTTFDAISTFVTRSGDRSLRFYFVFSRFLGAKGVTAHARVESMSAYLARAHRIHLQCLDSLVVPLVQVAFSHVYAPILRSLAIFVPMQLAEHVLLPALVDPLIALPWFDNTFPRLERLDLFGLSFRYSQVDFPNLHVICLRALPDSMSLGYSSISDVFSRSPVLSSMCIATALSSQFSDMVNPLPIASPSLTEMHLRFSPDFAAAHMLQHLSVPNVTSLYTDVGRLDLAQDFAFCAPFLAQITLLSLRDATMGTYVPCGGMFSFLSSLTTLDLRRCTSTVFENLFSTSNRFVTDGRTTILPQLRAIHLRCVDLEEVMAFAVLHGANDSSDGTHMSLAHVSVVRVDPLVVNSVALRLVIVWLASHVVSFTLDVAPPSF